MTPFRFRALAAAPLVMLALSPGLAAANPAKAPAAEVDTSNGVAPIKPAEATPEKPAAAAAAPAAEQTAPPAAPPAATPAKAPAAATGEDPPAAPASDVQRYCQNIAVVAAEARFAWQTKKLTELQAQVSERIATLEAKQAELKQVLAKRDDVMKRAEATLIGIYAKMKADVAASQLSALDDEMAAAVLAQLNPRQSSAILNEITPERASRLVNTMVNLPAPAANADGKKT